MIGDLAIDTHRHAVRRGRREITLTATEFGILLHLTRNAGRVVSRSDLMAPYGTGAGPGAAERAERIARWAFDPG